MMKNIIITLTLFSSVNSSAIDKFNIKSITTFNSEVFNVKRDIKELKVIRQHPFIKELTLNNGQIIDVSEIKNILIDRYKQGVDGGGITTKLILGDGSGG